MTTAINIEWDTDGTEEALSNLPDEVIIPENVNEEDISDYLSDEYGYCVLGCDVLKEFRALFINGGVADIHRINVKKQ